MLVLGIDPGYERLGFALAKRENGRDSIIDSGCLRTPKTLTFAERLANLGQELEKIFAQHQPDLVAIEKLFFSKNQKTAGQVAEVRGLILYLAGCRKLPVVEYTPQQIKQTTTGFGGANKRQVINWIERLVSLPKKERLDDEFDAIGAALTGLSTHRA